MDNIKITTENKKEISLWDEFKRSKIWLKIVDNLKAEVDKSDLIINQLGGDREVEFTKRDIAIVNKNSYLKLIELPDEMIKMLSGTGIKETEDFDPFGSEEESEDDDL